MTAAGMARRRRVAAAALITLAACGCGSSPGPGSAAGPSVPASRQALAAAYLTIAVAGNHRLEIDFNRLAGPDRGHLTAAQADLRDVAATERLFDRRLLLLRFPAPTEEVARFLAWVNQSRVGLTARAAGSVSVRQLDSYRRRLAEANVPVEQAVAIIRARLGLPPPATS